MWGWNPGASCRKTEQVEGARVPSIWGALKLPVLLPSLSPRLCPGLAPVALSSLETGSEVGGCAKALLGEPSQDGHGREGGKGREGRGRKPRTAVFSSSPTPAGPHGALSGNTTTELVPLDKTGGGFATLCHTVSRRLLPPPHVGLMTRWHLSAKDNSLWKGAEVGPWVHLLVTGTWMGHHSVPSGLQPCLLLPQNAPHASPKVPLPLPPPLPLSPLKVLLGHLHPTL